MIKKKQMLFVMMFIGTMLAGCSASEPGNRADKLTVTFMDVGQGNAVLVEHGGQYMLIDGGDREYSSYVVSYLKDKGIEELAYVITSHYDADHLNGVVGTLNAFDCDTVLAPEYTTDTRVYESFRSVIEEKDINLVYPSVGDTYTFGNAEFTVVCPDNYDASEDNDNSVGIRLVYGENSFLICGDAGKAAEEAMVESGLELTSDVYLASHHGSGGSSYRFFLDEVEPEAVVISAGVDNSYGHPAEIVLSNIKNLGASLYRTDLQGEIIVTSDGTNLEWNVEASADYRNGDEVAENISSEDMVTDKTVDAKEHESETSKNAEAWQEQTYILNTNTKKFHLPGCSSVSDMKEENKAEFSGSREELTEAGYSPCGRCKP